MNTATTEAIKARAKQHPRAEVCGLIVQREGGVELLVHARNVYPEPHIGFQVDPDSWLAAERLGRIAYVYHSHPTSGCTPTGADRKACDVAQLPYMIYSVPDDAFHVLYPEPRWKEIVGRPYESGKYDCATVVIDYMRLEHGIVLDVTSWRPEGVPYVTEDVLHSYGLQFGFREIPLDELRVGDCMSVRVHSEQPNGAAVYVGDGQVLVQPHKTRARLLPFDDRIRAVVVRAYRHEALFDAD